MITRETLDSWFTKITFEEQQLEAKYPSPFVPCRDLSNEELDELK